MAANILRSDEAVHMSIYVVRAFVKQREQVVANAARPSLLLQGQGRCVQRGSQLRSSGIRKVYYFNSQTLTGCTLADIR